MKIVKQILEVECLTTIAQLKFSSFLYFIFHFVLLQRCGKGTNRGPDLINESDLKVPPQQSYYLIILISDPFYDTIIF